MTTKRTLIVFSSIALVWLALDRASKAHFEFYFSLGETMGPFLGLFQFRLVHNTGAAWGMFSDSTVPLAILACIICAGILLALYFFRKRLSLGEIIAAAFVFAGGVGNAFDRFVFGYVTDFIEFTFIDFPVFNVADIGVTCGVVLFLVFYLLRSRKEIQALKKEESAE